ncbi:hypothetical protein AB3S75_037560 [Citrus x aurantiifolia]
MKLISWNVRGLRNYRTFREIKRILRELKPEIVFLCETKLSEQFMKRKASELNFQNCFAVSSSGKRGGLAMMWSENVNLEIKSYSKHHIDTCIQTAEGSYWRGTVVYGNPKMEERKHTWELLKRLSGLLSLPWICFGDVNDIMHLHEKIGGNDRKLSLITYFREAIKDSGLTDLGYKGYLFTWCNRRFGPQIIEERLDRALCSKNWGNIFQEFPVVHLETWSSDHYPIVMEVAEKVRGASYNKRTFPRTHYEVMWSPYEKCQEIVRREWLEQSKWDGTITSEQFKKVAKRSLAELKL